MYNCGVINDEGFKMNKNVGKKFNRLLIKSVEYIAAGTKGATYLKALCLCDCGKEKYIRLENVVNGRTVSCGCFRKEKKIEEAKLRQKYSLQDCIGKTYGRLTVLSESYKRTESRNFRLFDCKCLCGNITSVEVNILVNGKTKSCGCYNQEQRISNNTTHGMSKTRIYRIWNMMVSRSIRESDEHYADYGGRGIGCSESWKTFENFYEDMKDSYSDDLTLDRRDNDAGYSKENCRWVSRKIQNHNQRKMEGCYSEYIGVTVQRNGKFQARISNPESIRISLGTYYDELKAAEKYDDAYEKFYGGRPNKTIKE